MFAVPGWAVSASALVQERPRPKNSKANKSDVSTAKTNKKRKRDTNDGNIDTTTTTYEDTVISGKAKTISHISSPPITSPAKAEQKNSSIPKERMGAGDSDILAGKAAQSNLITSDSASRNQQKSSLRPTRTVENIQQSDSVQNNPPPQTSKHNLTSAKSAHDTKLTPLQAKMRSKLTSARFRHLNETLYTTSSSDALSLFTTSPELFADYHAGFAQQVKDSWPQNPVDDYIKAVKIRGASSDSKQNPTPLPRRKTGSCTIADLGCGDAPLARGCQSIIKSLQLKFHNYDLHAVNPSITKADISNLPLRDGEADIAVFCLSLMGTNWISFVEEAWRVLRGDGKGEVWVAEVKSRFGRVTRGRVVENSVGKRRKKPLSGNNNDDDGYDGPEQFVEDNRAANGHDDETDISAFIKVFTRRGFQLREGSVNKRNKMFVSMVFTKSGIPTAGKHKGLKWTGREYQKQQEGKMRFAGGQKDNDEVSPDQEAKVLKPCVYKIR